MEKRLRQSIDYLIDSREVFNDADLANQLGVHRSYLSRVLHGNKTVTPKFVEKLTKRFPKINGNWILTGEGEMVIAENHIGDNIVTAKATGNSTANATVNYHTTPQTQDLLVLQGKVDVLEKEKSELQRLLEEEKERSQKYWKMIEKLTSN